MARIALNHNETPAPDRPVSAGRPAGRRVRTARTALALSAAATVPAVALAAAPGPRHRELWELDVRNQSQRDAR